MNYFELYDIPEQLEVETSLAKKKFLELSRKFHPDFYGNESEEKQEEALELSTQNTNAFNTFKSIDKTIEYVLNLHNLLDEKAQLPPDFLMEMMEINESLMELEFDFDKNIYNTIKNNFDVINSELETIRQNLTQSFEKSDNKEEALQEVKNYYLKKKYVLRINETLNKFASRS